MNSLKYLRQGRVYEVFVDGKAVGLVGSTVNSLKKRRVYGYTKMFGPSVELRLLREIPIPLGYDAHGYNIYLKACEAMDIARKKTYREHGGLNKISPLIQVLGKNFLEVELGRLGGSKGSPAQAAARKKNGKNAPTANRVIGFKKWAAENPEKANINRIKGGSVSGAQNAVSGRIQKLGRIYGAKATAIGRCSRWNIQRGKPCVCGNHE